MAKLGVPGMIDVTSLEKVVNHKMDVLRVGDLLDTLEEYNMHKCAVGFYRLLDEVTVSKLLVKLFSHSQVCCSLYILHSFSVGTDHIDIGI